MCADQRSPGEYHVTRLLSHCLPSHGNRHSYWSVTTTWQFLDLNIVKNLATLETCDKVAGVMRQKFYEIVLLEIPSKVGFLFSFMVIPILILK